MSRISELIAERCPQGVVFMALGHVCIIKTGSNINKQVIAGRPGPYPVINSGRDPLGYVDHFNTENDPIGIASRGSVGLVTWTPGRFFRGNLNYSCTVKSPAQLDVRFLYHYLLHVDAEIQGLATHQGIPALNAGALKTLQVPIPLKEVQIEIIRILDTFTELITELTAELTARKTQYKHYRDQLLSFDGRSVEWKALGELGEFIRGKRFTKADYVENGIPVIHYGEIYTRYGAFATHAHSQVRGDMAESLRYAEPGDVVLTDVGETVEDVGKAVAWLGNGKVAIHDHCYAFRHAMNPKFVSYCMQTASFIAEKAKYVARTKVNTLLINGFAKIAIPVPFPHDMEKSLAEQARIVAILDKFDTLTSSITEGLPREIELRQKQYEHYRDLLLNFPRPKEVAA